MIERPLPAAECRRRPSFAALALAACALVCAGTLQRAHAQAPADGAVPLSTQAFDANRLTAMGLYFDQSEPPSQDLEKARDLYCRAAALGHPEALRRLGWVYLKGRGVAIDERVAGTMFRWAVDLGDGEAAGLAAAYPALSETPAPCLARLQISSSARLRERRQSDEAARRPPPAVEDAARTRETPIVENPARFRDTPVPIDQRRLVQTVVQEARAFRLDPRLVLAVMRAESGFDPLARSPRNAQGLMQLIPETAQRFNVRDPFDPVDNLRGGMAYLRWLLAYYRGDVPLALAAYNAGEGAVDRHRGVPPYPETLGYVQRIRALYPFDRHPFDRSVLAAHERSWLDRDVAAATR